MKTHIRRLLELQKPLPQKIAEKRANCFNAVQLFWEDESEPAFTGPVEFVEYLESKFRQLSDDEEHISLDVAVIWSRSSDALPIGAIRTDALNRRDDGYPFGLIIEHAFVLLDPDTAFQKRDPSELGAFEIVSSGQAVGPYLNARGFEITFHRRQ